MPERPPLIPYGRQWLDDDDVAAVTAMLRGEWLTTGPLVERFEQAIAARGGSAHAVAVSSGTAALHAAYAAAGLGRGDEIVTSPLTFASTASVALHLGAGVRFADVDPGTGNLDPHAMDAAVSAATRLIVPVDYAGHPADYDTIRAIAARRGLGVVADGAHSFGATFLGRPVGALADATATSFHPVKPITTGEGGAVLTDIAEWRDRAAAFRNHGIVRDAESLRRRPGSWHYEVQSLGLNYRLPDILCALGLSQLARLDLFLERRREIALRYTRAFADLAALEPPVVQAGTVPGWHLYVLRVRDANRRKSLFDFLRAAGLGVQLHYTPVHLHPLFEDLGFRAGCCPVAEDFAARAISIPLFPRMTDEEVDRVIETVIRGTRETLGS